jgi:chromosome segregation ATPase
MNKEEKKDIAYPQKDLDFDANILKDDNFDVDSSNIDLLEPLEIQDEEEKINTNFNNIEIPTPNEGNNKLNEITAKYCDVINQLNSLENDKSQLNGRLEDAISKIKEFTVNIEQKERLIDEFESIKRNFERKEEELFEKIRDLEEKLNIENKNKSHSDIGFNVEDYANNQNNLSINLNEEEIIEPVLNINSNKEAVDEIYNTIQAMFNDKENNINF